MDELEIALELDHGLTLVGLSEVELLGENCRTINEESEYLHHGYIVLVICFLNHSREGLKDKWAMDPISQFPRLLFG